MSLQDFIGMRELDGVYADPDVVTDIVRVLKNGNSRAAASSLVVTGAPSLCFGFTVSSANVGTQWIQVFDASSLPADGVVPLLSFQVSPGTAIGNQWTPPRSFRNGIVICNSTTQHTKTLGASDCIFDVQYL